MFKKRERENETTHETALDATESQGIASVAKARLPKPKFKLKGKKKAAVIVAIIIAIILIVLRIVGGGGESTNDYASTALVEKGTITKTISIKGTIEGSDSANVYSTVNYNIKSVNVKTGDRVSVGQVLATLDADALTSDYAKAAITVSEAKRKYESSKTLYNAGALSQSDYLDAKASYDTAVLAQNALNINENSHILSPISGVVTRVNATVGKSASPSSNDSEPLFVIENLDKLQMKVQIGEYDISDIRIGQTATITSDMLGKESVNGTVSHIAPTGEKQDTSSKSMVIPITIDVDKGDTNLIAGVTAKAVILIAEKQNVFTVPIDAVLVDADTDKSYLFTVSNDGILKKVPVTVGLEGDLTVEVSGKGISEGQRVLLSPTYDNYAGMQVTLSPEDLGADAK